MALLVVPIVIGAASLMGYGAKGYFGAGPSKDLEPKMEDFEYIKRDEEVFQEKWAKIMELADKVFISTSEDTVTYNYGTLMQGGTINDDILFSFKRFSEKGYLRRCEQIGDIFKGVKSNYQKLLSERLIIKYYGIKNTPMQCLQGKLAEKDPVALRISAILFQLGDDAKMLPIDLSVLDDQALVISCEVGRIKFQGLNQFTITGDRIEIVDKMTGTVIGGYNVNRTVTIGSPNPDGSVECKITRVFERFNLAHEG